MTRIKQPTKEQIRQYLTQRRVEKSMLPSMHEIRRRLGWDPVRTKQQNQERFR
jgi:hypothetical protein